MASLCILLLAGCMQSQALKQPLCSTVTVTVALQSRNTGYAWWLQHCSECRLVPEPQAAHMW
jgi:hypothetical protein